MQTNETIQHTDEESHNEKLKKRALSLYKKYKTNMDTLSSERRETNKYYFGELRGDEVEGRSKVISRDQFEVIEWMLPDFMRIFYGGRNVAEVNPQGADDVDKAKLMEEKVSFDFQKQNPGFKILYQWFKDALSHRFGVVKYYWDTSYRYKYHEYKEIPHSYYMDLVNKGHIIDEMVTVSEGIQGIGGMFIQEPIYNIKCREKIKNSKPVAINIPHEEIYFNIDMKSVEDLEGVIVHRMRVHKRKLKDYGFNTEDINDSIDGFENSTELQSRFQDIGGLSFITDDKESDFIYLNECYLYDFDNNGDPIPKIVHIVGDKVGKVEVNKYGKPPFCFITPIMVAHRLIGLAVDVKDIQDARTALLRNILDNTYYQNNGETIYNPNRVELPEHRMPGQRIPTKEDVSPKDVVYHVPVTPLAPQTVNIYSQVLPESKSQRTGINKLGQGLDPKSIVNRTLGGVSQTMTAANAPKELIARVFAETGVRDLFTAFVEMNIMFLDMPTNIQINKEWITIKPEDINGMFDISIDIGIGTGTKDQMFNHMINMLNIYGNIANVGGPAIQEIFWMEEIKNILLYAWELLGVKNAAGRFVSNRMGGMANGGQGAGIVANGGEGAQVPGTPSAPGVQRTPNGVGMQGREQMEAMHAA